ncbi:unnamed protein product, partial [Heligmosomoides polygyrus]|uniref:Uncharacterized protein n=1 Tax=Heligmosomoides polygyrus TaxID=6339 RepID=A0A183FLY6_HELPZ
MCIVLALLAMVTDTACLFYPFLLIVRQLQNNPFVFPGAVQHPNVVVLPAEPELGNTNPDDPPPYSTIASEREENSGETAKEETLPPRYSELDRTSSSDSPEDGNKQPRRFSSDILKKTVVIQKRSTAGNCAIFASLTTSCTPSIGQAERMPEDLDR